MCLGPGGQDAKYRGGQYRDVGFLLGTYGVHFAAPYGSVLLSPPWNGFERQGSLALPPGLSFLPLSRYVNALSQPPS